MSERHSGSSSSSSSSITSSFSLVHFVYNWQSTHTRNKTQHTHPNLCWYIVSQSSSSSSSIHMNMWEKCGVEWLSFFFLSFSLSLLSLAFIDAVECYKRRWQNNHFKQNTKRWTWHTHTHNQTHVTYARARTSLYDAWLGFPFCTKWKWTLFYGRSFCDCFLHIYIRRAKPREEEQKRGNISPSWPSELCQMRVTQCVRVIRCPNEFFGGDVVTAVISIDMCQAINSWMPSGAQHNRSMTMTTSNGQQQRQQRNPFRMPVRILRLYDNSYARVVGDMVTHWHAPNGIDVDFSTAHAWYFLYWFAWLCSAYKHLFSVLCVSLSFSLFRHPFHPSDHPFARPFVRHPHCLLGWHFVRVRKCKRCVYMCYWYTSYIHK